MRERSSHTLRLQKTLEDANIKLDSVITDIVGLSGRRMIEALIAGQTNPEALAALAHRRIHATSAELEAALRGRVTAHHRFMPQLHLDHLDAVNAAIARIDKEVDGNVEPFRVAIEMLTTIPGVSSLAAEVMVSEIGIARRGPACGGGHGRQSNLVYKSGTGVESSRRSRPPSRLQARSAGRKLG